MAGYKERSHVWIAAFLREEHPELREYADLFDIYRKNRHESLYGIDYDPIDDDARSGIEYAGMFIQAVDEVLNDPYDQGKRCEWTRFFGYLNQCRDEVDRSDPDNIQIMERSYPLMDPHSEADLFGSIAEYAFERYRERLKDMFDEYWERFPEKDWDLPDEAAFKNFMTYLIYEVPFLKGGKTMAEDFAINSKDLDSDTRESIMKMRHMIRSQFVVISRQGKNRAIVKDLCSKIRYPLIFVTENDPPMPNDVIEGRIHPFGDHYRFSGICNIEVFPVIMDPEVYMEAWKKKQMGELESIEIRPGSSFSSILMKYPAHWIDKLAEIHGVEERLKRDKVNGIVERIVGRMPSIWKNLSSESREVLRICLDDGGYVKTGKLKDYSDDTTYFWPINKEGTAPLGDLRRKGLLIVGKMRIGSRNYSVAFIPKEFRDPISKCK